MANPTQSQTADAGTAARDALDKADQDERHRLVNSGRGGPMGPGNPNAPPVGPMGMPTQVAPDVGDTNPAAQDTRYNYVNPGAANVGGHVGGGEEIRQQFLAGEKANNAAMAGNRAATGVSLANMRSDRGQVSPENAKLLAREASSRNQQGQALDLQRDAALGNAPSAAAYKTSMGMNDVMSGQAGAAGAAHGLSALGGVQGVGASGVGQAAQQIGLEGGMGRSGEVGQAIGMYGTSAADMRTGDLGRVNQSNQNLLANQGLNDAWKVGNANLAAKQGQLGVAQGQLSDAYYNSSTEPAQRQLGYDQEMLAIQAGASADSAAAKRAAADAAGDRNRALAGGASQAGLTAIGSLGGPAGTAAGGYTGGMVNSYINKKDY